MYMVKPEAKFLDEIHTKVLELFSSLLFTVTSTALPWDFYFSRLTQPLTVSVKKKRGKPERKPYPLPYGLQEIHTGTSQEYAQKPQWNCTFMNSASGQAPSGVNCLGRTAVHAHWSRAEESGTRWYLVLSAPWGHIPHKLLQSGLIHSNKTGGEPFLLHLIPVIFSFTQRNNSNHNSQTGIFCHC